MREAALDELCVAFGKCILVDEHAPGMYPELLWAAHVLADGGH